FYKQQPAFDVAHQQYLRLPLWPRFFLAWRGDFLLPALLPGNTASGQRTCVAIGPAAGATGRAQNHDGLWVVGDPLTGRIPFSQCPERPVMGGSTGGGCYSGHTSENALGIAIEYRCPDTESLGCNGAGSGSSDTGK